MDIVRWVIHLILRLRSSLLIFLYFFIPRKFIVQLQKGYGKNAFPYWQAEFWLVKLRSFRLFFLPSLLCLQRRFFVTSRGTLRVFLCVSGGTLCIFLYFAAFGCLRLLADFSRLALLDSTRFLLFWRLLLFWTEFHGKELLRIFFFAFFQKSCKLKNKPCGKKNEKNSVKT